VEIRLGHAGRRRSRETAPSRRCRCSGLPAERSGDRPEKVCPPPQAQVLPRNVLPGSSSSGQARLVRHHRSATPHCKRSRPGSKPVVQNRAPAVRAGSAGGQSAATPGRGTTASSVLKEQSCPADQRDARRWAVEIAPQRFERLAAAAGVLFEGKQIIQRERTHEN